MYDVFDIRELKQMLKVLVNTVSSRLDKEKQAQTVSLQINMAILHQFLVIKL